MMKPRTARFLRHTLRDFGLGLLLFVAIAGVGAIAADSSLGQWLCNSAQARSYSTGLGAPVTPVPGLQLVTLASEAPRPGVSMPSLPLLAGLFSLVVALDLWFWRHLRRVYASTRPGGWRRG